MTKMRENTAVTCIYCDNPRPDVVSDRQNKKSISFSILGIIKYTQEKIQNTQSTLRVHCSLCGRKYLLYATRNNIGFINAFLKQRVKYTDDVIDGLKYYDFTPEDIPHYVVGLSKPKSHKSNEIHVILDKPNGKYYLRGVKDTNMDIYIVNNIEKV